MPTSNPENAYSDSDRFSDRIIAVISNHVGIAASAAIALFFSLRLLAAGHGHPTTAIALVDSTSAVTTIVPMIYDLAAVTLPWLPLLAAYRDSEPKNLRPEWLQTKPSIISYVAIASLPSVFICPWKEWTTCVPWSLAAAMTVTALWLEEHGRDWSPLSGSWVKWLGRHRAFITFGVLSFVLWVAIHNDRMWLPAEQAELHGKPTTFYVLKQTDYRSLILLDEHREIEWVSSSDIKGRTFCTRRSAYSSLVSGLLKQPDYDDCPA